jgi:hypothetical protein
MKISDILREQTTQTAAAGIKNAIGFADVTKPEIFMNAVGKINKGLTGSLTRDENQQLSFALMALIRMDPDQAENAMTNLQNILKQQSSTQATESITEDSPTTPPVQPSTTAQDIALSSDASATGLKSVTGMQMITRPQIFMTGLIKLVQGLRNTLTWMEVQQLGKGFASLVQMNPDQIGRALQGLKNIVKKQSTAIRAATQRKG